MTRRDPERRIIEPDGSAGQPDDRRRETSWRPRNRVDISAARPGDGRPPEGGFSNFPGSGSDVVGWGHGVNVQAPSGMMRLMHIDGNLGGMARSSVASAGRVVATSRAGSVRAAQGRAS